MAQQVKDPTVAQLTSVAQVQYLAPELPHAWVWPKKAIMEKNMKKNRSSCRAVETNPTRNHEV